MREALTDSYLSEGAFTFHKRANVGYSMDFKFAGGFDLMLRT